MASVHDEQRWTGCIQRIRLARALARTHNECAMLGRPLCSIAYKKNFPNRARVTLCAHTNFSQKNFHSKKKITSFFISSEDEQRRKAAAAMTRTLCTLPHPSTRPLARSLARWLHNNEIIALDTCVYSMPLYCCALWYSQMQDERNHISHETRAQHTNIHSTRNGWLQVENPLYNCLCTRALQTSCILYSNHHRTFEFIYPKNKNGKIRFISQNVDARTHTHGRTSHGRSQCHHRRTHRMRSDCTMLTSNWKRSRRDDERFSPPIEW